MHLFQYFEELPTLYEGTLWLYEAFPRPNCLKKKKPMFGLQVVPHDTLGTPKMSDYSIIPTRAWYRRTKLKGKLPRSRTWRKCTCLFTFPGKNVGFTLSFEQWLMFWLSGYRLRKKNIGKLVTKMFGADLMEWARSVKMFLYCMNVHQGNHSWPSSQISCGQDGPLRGCQWISVLRHSSRCWKGLRDQMAMEAGMAIICGLNNMDFYLLWCDCNY